MLLSLLTLPLALGTFKGKGLNVSLFKFCSLLPMCKLSLRKHKDIVSLKVCFFGMWSDSPLLPRGHNSDEILVLHPVEQGYLALQNLVQNL